MCYHSVAILKTGKCFEQFMVITQAGVLSYWGLSPRYILIFRNMFTCEYHNRESLLEMLILYYISFPQHSGDKCVIPFPCVTAQIEKDWEEVGIFTGPKET